MILDALIIGHGLAGAVLAETLRHQGLRFHVLHGDRPGAASPVAAGMVNPIAFRRDIATWRAALTMPLADDFYTRWEQRLGVPVWKRMPLAKIFPSEDAAMRWQRAAEDPDTAAFIGAKPSSAFDDLPLQRPFGHGMVTTAAWLDVARALEAHRAMLQAEGCCSHRVVPDEAIEHEADHIRIDGFKARWSIRCLGPFDRVQGLVPVKGETIVVRIPDLPLERMVHRGIFLIPLGDALFRVGATYKWTDVWAGPTTEAREMLLEGLGKIVRSPVEVVDHLAGVRPAARDRRPILGRVGEREAVLNGLGSRGVLLAPWCASHLAAHLFNGAALDPEVDVARFA
ncbi:MAG: FAD-dependent oxidoreductase [Flavobacteriales bacterium]